MEIKVRLGRFIRIAGFVLLFGILLSGCEQLKEKEPEKPGRTTGEEYYTGFEDIGPEYSDEDVVKDGGLVCGQARIVDGRNNWDNFMKAVEEQKPASIRIMQKITEDNVFYKDVIYDGKSFRMVISVDPGEYDFTYRYLLDLEGRRTEESKRSRLVVLTDDENVSFEEVIESEGKNEEEKLAEYQLIFRE